MLVEVIYNSGNKGMVESNELGMLINSKLISRFKRSTGWIDIDSEEIRRKRHLVYGGEEKRSRH